MYKQISAQLNDYREKVTFFPKEDSSSSDFLGNNSKMLAIGASICAYLYSQCKSLRSYAWTLGLPAGVCLALFLYNFYSIPTSSEKEKNENAQPQQKPLRPAIQLIGMIAGSVLSGISLLYLLKGSTALISGIYDKKAYQMLKGFKHLILSCGILIPYTYAFFLKIDKANSKDQNTLIEEKNAFYQSVRTKLHQIKSNPLAPIASYWNQLKQPVKPSGFEQVARAKISNEGKKLEWLTFDLLFAASLAAVQIHNQLQPTITGLALGILALQLAPKVSLLAKGVEVLNVSKRLAHRVFSIHKGDNSISGYSKRMFLSLMATTYVMNNGPWAPVVAGLFYSQTINSFLSKN